ncbi:MAG TPA: GYF domain-containing protein [Polyangiales bacterium]
MKFLCGNCKAKYQIADEKASGKTLRMKCRRCGHDILIDGHNVSQSSAPPAAAAAPAPRRSASVVPSAARSGSGARELPSRPLAPQGLPPRPATLRSKPPASALGSEFRRHIAAPPEVPQRTAPYDLWHAAIKDVPVGPMTREELGRKIEAGAVTEDSLCWREGMDDWKPLGELPELAQLLRRSREGSRSRPPPPRHRPPPHVPAHPPTQGARAPSQYPEEELEEDYSEPTRIADMSQGMPVMSHGTAGAQHAGGTSPKIALPPQQQVAAALAPSVEVSAPAPMPRQPAGGWGTMTNGIAIGLLLGILLLAGPMLYNKFWGDAPTATETAKPVEQQPVAVAPVSPAARDIQLEQPVEPEVKEQPTAKTPKPGTTPPNRGAKTEAKEGGKELSAEEQALLKRMGGGGDVPLQGRPGGGDSESGGGGGGPTLTGPQLSKVVQDNKVQLQRCYETALRAAGGRQEGTIKVVVAVTVGMSGSVKSVGTQGAGLGNMNDCIKQSVRRWRFPQSGGDSPFEFPLVFQPGA